MRRQAVAELDGDLDEANVGEVPVPAAVHLRAGRKPPGGDVRGTAGARGLRGRNLLGPNEASTKRFGADAEGDDGRGRRTGGRLFVARGDQERLTENE